MTAGTLPAGRSRARAATETALLAIGLGVLADILFRDAALGLNAPLWIGGLVAAVLLTGRHREAPPSRAEAACLLISFAAASALAWRASPALQALLFLASGGFLVLGAAVRSGVDWRRAGVAVSLGAVVATTIAIASGLHRVQAGLELRNSALRRSKEGAGTAIRTIVIGTPILLVFALLFASADAVFEERLRWLARFDLSPIASHLLWFAAGAWFGGGVVWATFDAGRLAVPAPRLPEERRLRAAEVSVILGSLAALFGAFVAIQVRYLFGGDNLVRETVGLTYAEYAHRGFFELVAAATLLLPLLLVADWARRRGGRTDTAYRLLAAILVALLFVVMLSALQRMSAYERAFGLTEARVYAVAVLLWLALVFGLMLRTLVAARSDWFVAGSVASAVAILAVLTVVSPDALIARRNIERASVAHPLDVYHAANLSPDAAPTLVRKLGRMSPEDACVVAGTLLDRWGHGSGDDLRSWNWGRAAAARTVGEHADALEEACGARRSRAPHYPDELPR